jgi:hypothetical protein
MTDPVFRVERGCDATRQGMGCGCTGACHELIEVVKATDYFRLLGRLDQALERAGKGEPRA